MTRTRGIFVACCLLFSGVRAAEGAVVTVAWDPSPGATGYVVFYGTQTGIYTTSVNVGNQQRYQVQALNDGTTYYFVVRAYASDPTVLSAPSQEVSGAAAAATTILGMTPPPDAGSVTGVSTATGTNVTVMPVYDVLVKYSSVTTTGQTRVDVADSPQTSGPGYTWSPWVYQISTTAVVSGPVTIAIAYSPSLLSPRVGTVRIMGATTTTWDKVNGVIYATVPSLPATVTVVNDVVNMNTDFNGDGRPDLLWRNDD